VQLRHAGLRQPVARARAPQRGQPCTNRPHNRPTNQAGGGEHGGKPWSAEAGLPTDSGLLFYLFAAFLDAPGWSFPPPGAARADSGRWGCAPRCVLCFK
jgi:hypothetical protein